jgi:integrase
MNNNTFHIPEYNCGLRDVFSQFIRHKVSTGRKECLYTTVLKTFDTFCILRHPAACTLEKDAVDDFLQITEQRKLSSVHTYASVLRELGRFSRLVLGNEDAYISQLHGSRKSTYTPYIFSKKQMSLLLAKASAFQHCNDRINPNMSNSISCLYAMLYCTGMRVSETLALKLVDVSVDKATILVTESKGGRQRLLPISESLATKCHDYLSKRHSIHTNYFFDTGSDSYGGHISGSDAYRFFRVLLLAAGIPHRGKGEGPRLHDLRDTFAVHSLQKLIEMGGDVNAALEYLSLYLGHRSIYETQDYLWLTEELAEDMLCKTSGDTAFLSDQFRRKVVIPDV